MIQTLLLAATYAIAINDDAAKALDYLSEARAIARRGDTQRCKVIACHCTQAMQALYPLAVQL